MRFFRYFSIVILLLALALCAEGRSRRFFSDTGNIFGTYYNVKIQTRTAVPGLKEEIQKEFALVNQQMSVFEKKSEINKINALDAGEELEISDELALLLNTAQRIYKESGGAFDPTVGKLVNLWGFGVDGKHNIPEDSALKNELKYVGMDNIVLEDNVLTKKKSGTYLNLSAIAKGYAVDRLAQMFKKRGYNNFLIDIGGEVYASGRKSKKTPGWNIGIAEPSESEKKNHIAFMLTDMAVATSGDYRNFYYVDGKRYAHTISPKTGYPVEHNLVSATVFAKNCMEADAYATAIMSMGEDKGLTFADKYNLAAILFVRDSNGQITGLYSKQAVQLIGD